MMSNRSQIVRLIGALMLSLGVVGSSLSYDLIVEDGDLPDLNHAILPIMFEDDFESGQLSTATWAYDVLRARIEENNADPDGQPGQVLDIGHNQEWSSMVLQQGRRWRDYVVELDVSLLTITEGADNFFLGVRYDRDDGEYAMSLDMANQTVTISRTEDGFWDGELLEVPVRLELNEWYRLTVHVEDDLIQFFLDGTPMGQIRDDAVDVGSVRMLTPPGGYALVDNFVVREIPSAPRQGDLLITEIYLRENGLQWFEVMNDASRHISLDGVQISNGTAIHEISDDSGILAPDEYFVMAAENPTSHFTLHSDYYVYGADLRFTPDNGTLQLAVDDEVVTQINYSEDTGWLLQDYVSTALHPDHLRSRSQDNALSWCPSVQLASTNPLLRASPGTANHLCVRESSFHDLSQRQSGDLVITEIMVNLPGSDSGREWFELFNTTNTAISLQGLTIGTDSPTERHTIIDEVVIQPYSFAVLGQAGLMEDELPDRLASYFYPGQLRLRNSDGELSIRAGERIIDSVTWRENGWWPFRAGTSMSLHPDIMSAYSNDDALNWCLAWSRVEDNPEILATPGAPNDPCPMWEINSPMKDEPRAYELATPEPITISITLDPNDLEAMKVNPFSDEQYPARFEADGYESGDGNNATMRPRGGVGSRAAGIQSYRVRLQGQPFWGHRTLMLNKHLGDPSRLRNALSFQLFQEMDNIVSMRTQFVHLFVNGDDLGLYTMIESHGSRYLRNHNLDERGHLFKIGLPSDTNSFFHFDGVHREARNQSIESTAEIEAGYTHDGLIDMIDAVYSDMDIDQVIDRHFNRENLLTYFAALYLMENPDTRVQNYMLYTTPREPSRIYFLPWDWDNAFLPRDTRTVFVGRWRQGFGTWSEMGIVNRMLKDPEIVDALILKMVELAQTSLSQERVNALVDQLVAAVEPFTLRRPELLEMTPEKLAAEAAVIKSVIVDSAHQLSHFIERPLPVSVDDVTYDSDGDAVTFHWQESFDLQGDPIYYEVVLFNDSQWSDDNVVWHSNLTMNTYLPVTIADLPPGVTAGRYYWMVYVYDSEGNYTTSNNVDTFGVIADQVNLP